MCTVGHNSLGIEGQGQGQSAVGGDSFNSSQLLNFSIRDLNHFIYYISHSLCWALTSVLTDVEGYGN